MRHRRRPRLLTTLATVVVLAVAGIAAWYEVEARVGGPPGAPVVVHITPGEGTASVAATLERRGVVGSALALRLSLLLHGEPLIRSGAYVFHHQETFDAVRATLAGGPNVAVVDVHPGNTLAEVANNLGAIGDGLAANFLADAKKGTVTSPFQQAPATSLEGLLGTGSYQVLPGETADHLLTQMVDRFVRQADAAGLSPSSNTGGLTPYQLVTLASIVEKEGYYDRYMGQVARVIYNRLGAGMPLAMTATVLYSLGQDGGTVTHTDQRLDTPYNTYLHQGLTPTPICVPSAHALASALAPPAGSWLYFDVVTTHKGTMVFSSTYAEQLAAEQQAAANAAAGGGGRS